MDERTFTLLEFGSIRALLADRAGSTLGKELAHRLAPLATVAEAELSLARVAEMCEAIGQRLVPPLGGLRDVRADVQKAGLGVLLELDAVGQIRDVLDLAGRVRDYAARLATNFPRLRAMLVRVGDFGHLMRHLEASIDDRGQMRADATPELAQIRRAIAHCDERVQNEMRRLLRSPEVRAGLRYQNATMNGEHHVLPVAVNYRHVVPGIVHRTSSTGETLFVEPAKVSEIAAEIAVLRSAEGREIRRILRKLTGLIAGEKDRLLDAVDGMAQLDFCHAVARFALDFAAHPPLLSTDGSMRLTQARHPILLDIFRQQNAERVVDESTLPKAVVPIDVHLGNGLAMLVVTGPNTGGKTVALKTVGLLCLMARCGLPVPAQPGSKVPFLDAILADIGDEQSLQQSLSTFSSHVVRIREILARAKPNTLVLLDELGAGTDPAEGAALGRALLDCLLKSGCLTMVTTHLGDLKTFALNRSNVENAAVEFDVATLQPTFRLFVGQSGQSCALRIARRLKLPREIVNRAERYLQKRRGRGERALGDVEKARADAEAERQRALAARTEAERTVAEYRQRVEQLQQESHVSAELEKARAALRPGDIVRVPRFQKSGKIVRVDHAKRKTAVTVGAVEWQLSLDEVVPTIDVGSTR